MIRNVVASLAVGLLATHAVAGALPALELEPVVDGLDEPLLVTHAGDGSGRLFIVEQAGRVLILEGGELRDEPFLDIRTRVRGGGERGLLGLAFHPRFAENGRLFVSYTRRRDAASVVAEHRVAADDPGRAATARRVLLIVPQPASNHNGGTLAFGPGGKLFVGLGDGGDARFAQDPDSLLGKILRIDVDGESGELPYAIPASNPFADGGGRPEIFALGFRNPPPPGGFPSTV